MSQSAAPATQNDMTTCLETFEKERFCSFPHRDGEARVKPVTRDETRGSIKTSISRETSSNFDTSLPQNRCFPLKICNLKIARGFRQFSSHLTKRHAYHGICTLSPLDAALTLLFAKTRDTTRLKCCACHAK